MTAAPTGGGEALVEALAYVEAGYVVGPVTIRLDERGKKVAEFHTRWVRPEPGELAVSSDPEQVAAWARQYPGCGFHAPCGPNGIVVVDADVKIGADSRLIADGPTAWRAARGPLSPMVVKTQSGGEHFHFKAPEEPIRNSSKAIAGIPDVDVRGDGGTVFVSGTKVHGGGSYVATRIVPRDELPALSSAWARKLRDAGPTGERKAPKERSEAAPRTRLVSASKVKDRAWIEATVDDELRELGRRGTDNFRSRLFEASAIVYRAVALEVVSEEEAEERLAGAILRVWDASPDRDDADHIRRGREAAKADPWRLANEEPIPTVQETLQADQEGGGGQDGPLTAEEVEERALRREVEELRRRQTALRRLQAEDAPPLRWLSFGEFLASPEPEPLVPGVFYRDSLSRIVGAPGCGKSFLALDLALRVALGRDWGGETVERGPVVYVMAEGQRVNTQRTKAWLDRNHVDPAEVEGWFYTVPEAVLLTDEGVRELADACRTVAPALVVLDTKNAMMAGEENSGTDSAVMRRALDVIRTASDACVVLIDHSPKAGGDDGRGSNAVKAAMDTQLLVENDGGRPALVTATVTRDKAAEAGSSWRWYLRMHDSSAVLVETDHEAVEREDKAAPAWRTADGVIVPTELLHYEGAGGKVMPELARFLAHEASPRHGDPEGVGVSRAEAVKAMRAEGYEETVVRRAWSALISRGEIDRANGCKSDTGRHVWTP